MKRFEETVETLNKPLNELKSLSKYAAYEGIVLLENKDDVLPLINKRVALFGRIQFNYYKSGTGSGGLVNVKEVPSLVDSLIKNPRVTLDKNIYNLYKEWVYLNPFNEGSGAWASEPWSQVEMDIDEDVILNSSKENDVAVVIFGRTAGEDRDNTINEGSYYLSKLEDLLLKKVTKHFKDVIVLLNVGNVIDLSFIDKYNIKGLILAFHGGELGAEALSHILTGYMGPTGKLPVTVPYKLTDFINNDSFGNEKEVIYHDDIYVGYRYFNTFKEESIRYHFGYGLTYSNFLINSTNVELIDNDITFSFNVKNIGNFKTKEVVQVYVNKPQGLLGKPKYELVGFLKTNELLPNKDEDYSLIINLNNLASYDDSGLINKSSYVLEKGNYTFYIGNSLGNINEVYTYNLLETKIISKHKELSAPNINFKRIKPNNNLEVIYEDSPLRTVDYLEKIKEETKDTSNLNSNGNLNLIDVYNKDISIDQFINSLDYHDLIHLTRGEGMSSPKVTPGTAAAFGGVTNNLLKRGVPVACAADGPSGIRMDSGFYATSIPIGMALASSFNEELVSKLYYLVGLEMKAYNIDLLLAPGMNIIRHPLNGRNFEYFSEDPLLTGIMAKNVVKGLKEAGASGSLKHMFANNQETDRFNVNAVISERAQREIYLKGFEIAVKSNYADAIMTSYNPVNGIWSASNYDINQNLVKDEWGFKGIIITDWWAKMNDFNEEATKNNTKAMIRSGNDIYMVINDSYNNSGNDNTEESYLNNELSLYHLKLSAKNILNYLLTTKAFYKMHNLEYETNKIIPNDYFNVKKENTKFNYLNELNINEKLIKVNPLLFNQTLDINKISSIKGKNSLIELTKNNDIILLKEGPFDNLVYSFSNKTNLDNKKIKYDLKKLNENIININETPWQDNIFSFSKYVNKTKGIDVSNHLNITTKNNEISYLIKINSQSKYVFSFKLSSPLSNLQQIPFSIYVNEQHKSTLTIQGTLGNMIEAKAFIILDEGVNLFTLKFIPGNLNIQEINCQRHG